MKPNTYLVRRRGVNLDEQVEKLNELLKGWVQVSESTMLGFQLSPEVHQATVTLLEARLFFEIIGLLEPGIMRRTEKVHAHLVPGKFVLQVVEVEAQVLCHGFLVGLDNLRNSRVDLGQQLEVGVTVFELEHGALLSRVRLHAGEVPALELVIVDDAVAVQVEVFQSSCQLLFVELVAGCSRHGLELGRINCSAAVGVKLGEQGLEGVVLVVVELGNEEVDSLVQAVHLVVARADTAQ